MKKNIFGMAVIFVMMIIATAFTQEAKAQSMVTEVSWNVYSQNYTGLLVLYPNSRGFLKLKFFSPGVGWVWVQQDAVLSNQYDMYGNCTSYIYCSNPRTSPYVPYAADNFVIYPNGSMFTMDAGGVWSTQIVAYVVNPNSWGVKFQEYGIR